ncbi:MAG: oligopeptide/dipeptide ABC transporter ATP-binding protein [Jatrophihabitans sp.]|uniref:oligopeptide/dipeptide ABC transporter ATP-binding protein n=1 Tax=Jatrophihabitans sp. TaxID=1932789 RepID=UPI003F8010A4
MNHQQEQRPADTLETAADPVDLLRVEQLSVDFAQRGWRRPAFRAVDRVSITVSDRETVGLVGESGSGKSTVGRAILGLVRPSEGRIFVQSNDLTGTAAEHRGPAAALLQVVFQDPYSSLNPARTIAQTLAEPLESLHGRRTAVVQAEVDRLLRSVHLPADAGGRYPQSFSGGQRQRIAIARAIAASPRLLICDEATSALDVVTQAQILALLQELQAKLGLGMLFVSHNLPVVAQLSHRIVVLYRGRVMEQGPAADVHRAPLHPYTKALVAAVPVPDPVEQRRRRAERALVTKGGPQAAEPDAAGCPFASRCPTAAPICWSRRPADTAISDRVVACHMMEPASGHPLAVQHAPRAAEGVS